MMLSETEEHNDREQIAQLTLRIDVFFQDVFFLRKAPA